MIQMINMRHTLSVWEQCQHYLNVGGSFYQLKKSPPFFFSVIITETFFVEKKKYRKNLFCPTFIHVRHGVE